MEKFQLVFMGAVFQIHSLFSHSVCVEQRRVLNSFYVGYREFPTQRLKKLLFDRFELLGVLCKADQMKNLFFTALVSRLGVPFIRERID